ncbi:hypothetical protein [Nocardia sp. NPDC004604]|uniref:hypothetical protein n=1 Tax=Nocardia sp. NPDC004604 TaxID=3157013 RepID=UPI0033B84268
MLRTYATISAAYGLGATDRDRGHVLGLDAAEMAATNTGRLDRARPILVSGVSLARFTLRWNRIHPTA